MEVVLLWLDDLDDVVFTLALAWERLRRVTLGIGLVAALALMASELSAIAVQWAATFSGVAAASVGAWFVGAAFRAFYYRDTERGPATA